MSPALWVAVVNAAGVSYLTPRSRGVLRAALALLIRAVRRGPDLIFVSEAADLDLAREVDLEEWQVVQHGPPGSPMAGCALLARRSRVRLSEVRWELGAEAMQGIRARWFPVALAEVRHLGRWVTFGDVAAIHTPPGRAPRGQRVYEASLLSAAPDVLAGDFNRDADYLRRVLRRRVRAVEVLAVACTWRIHAGRPRRRDVGSDHPALITRLYLKRASRA